MENYNDDGYSNYMDPFDVNHNPFNMISMTEFYIYLLIAFIGLCILIFSGYCQFRGRNTFMSMFIIGMIVTGFSFSNILSIKLSETNMIVVAVLMFVHFIVCSLIPEGSTRHFMLKNEKRIKKQNDLLNAEKIEKIMEGTYITKKDGKEYNIL